MDDIFSSGKVATLTAHIAAGVALKAYSFDKYRTKEDPDTKPRVIRVIVQTKAVSTAEKAYADLAADARPLQIHTGNPTRRPDSCVTLPFGGILSSVEDSLNPNSMDSESSPGLPASRAELLIHLDRRFRTPLLAYFGRRVKSSPEAEDLTQDVFERLLRSLESKPIQNAEALVFRIAVNLLRDRARRAHTRGIEEPIPVEAIAEFADVLSVDLTPERVVLGERTLEEAFSALDELGERTRTMFYLYRFENLKIREIADMYGISTSWVEKQLERALMHITRRVHRT